ncbi:hypothetical protein BH20VER3_BH20VER3_15910 [soil metagenome]
MKIAAVAAASLLIFVQPVRGTQADDVVITIHAQTPGITPFISQLTLTATDTSGLRSIKFSIAPKPGSVTRPLSATYSTDYLISRGYLLPLTAEIFLPVYGLYDDYANVVMLTYNFADGSSKQDNTTITTSAFADPCQYKNPTVLQARTDDTDLSYDYMLVDSACSFFSPGVLDTDGALRWVGPGDFNQIVGMFFDNAFYQADRSSLVRIELDGTITVLHDYSDIGVTFLHHNIDRGKFGLILDVDTESQFESVNIEVDRFGNVLKIWNLADIITAAMTAGGDDPTQFVHPSPIDWFHNNGVAYNAADDSLVISSRENFLICIDYETAAIKWILGDPTKKWHQFPSLAQYALTLAAGSLPPIGQHSPSFTYDQRLLVMDNGFHSLYQMPRGENRTYASPRKYELDLETKTATEVWNYEMDHTIYSPLCSSTYEDAPLNYLVDYAIIGGLGAADGTAQILGLNASGKKVFYYQYPALGCGKAYRSIPLHLENTRFPTTGPQILNISTRGTISSGENVLIGGFIVTGAKEKRVVLRALGPSLPGSGVAGAAQDPVLTLYDSSGSVVATNDNWESDPGKIEISADGLAPSHSNEAATIRTLSPGAYTVTASAKDASSGVGLVEVYDLSPQSGSRLANISTRGAVGTGDNVLIGGFIVGDVANATVVIRALGPSLASQVSGNVLNDPTVTIFNNYGVAIAGNDNWQDDINKIDIEEDGLAPGNDAEAATILHPPAGAYTAIVSGASSATGLALLEVYDLVPSTASMVAH